MRAHLTFQPGRVWMRMGASECRFDLVREQGPLEMPWAGLGQRAYYLKLFCESSITQQRLMKLAGARPK